MRPGPPPLEISLTEAHALITKLTGRDMSVGTVYHWAQRGRNGKVLRTVRRAGRQFTTRAWVKKFLEEIGG